MVPTIEGETPCPSRAKRGEVMRRPEGATQPVIVSLIMSCIV